MDSSANAADDVEAMSIKEMKALITKAGLSHADCFEKSDLRQAARARGAREDRVGGDATLGVRRDRGQR